MKRKKSIYSVTFDEKNPHWTRSRKVNIMFLRLTQAYVNDLLRIKEYPGAHKHLFLNEVLERLGFSKTKEGHYVGWIYDEKNPIGDNYIDFDINPRGSNPNVVIDFNVDGVILDKVWEIFN